MFIISLFTPCRSIERDSIQKAFLPPLRTAPQRTSRPAPSPRYRKPPLPPPVNTHETNECPWPAVAHLLYMLHLQRIPAVPKHCGGAGPDLPGREAEHRGLRGGGRRYRKQHRWWFKKKINLKETCITMSGHSQSISSNIGTTCQSLPMPQTGLNDLLEEATFIPPTKRKTDKSGRVKSKKKDNCKHQ